MSYYEEQYGFAPKAPWKPADRRTCKMIKSHIAKYLVIDIGGLDLLNETATTIIHEAFNRAVNQFESEGYLTLGSLYQIVREEYLRRVTGKKHSKYDEWFNDFTL